MILEMAGRAAQILVALMGAYLVVLWFALIVWTFRDIESRSRNVFTQVFSTLLTVLFFVPGTLLYLLLRPKATLDEAFQRSLEEEYLLQDLEELPHCPSCHRFVEDDFVLCPHCHTQLREPCGSCERLVDLRWPLCPYCGAVHSKDGETGDKVEAPAARWTSPTLRRRRGAESLIGPRALPESLPAAPREQIAAASAATVQPELDDTSTFAASLASGVRSIVRPIDRLLGRGEESVIGANGDSAARTSYSNGAATVQPAANGATEPYRFPPAATDGGAQVPVRNRFASPAGVGPGDAGRSPDGQGADSLPAAAGEREPVTAPAAYPQSNGSSDGATSGWGAPRRDS